MLDGRGEPIPDGVMEIWQADPNGRFDHPDDPRGAGVYEGFKRLRPLPAPTTRAAGRSAR